MNFVRLLVPLLSLSLSIQASTSLQRGWNMVGITGDITLNSETISNSDISLIWQYNSILKNWNLYTELTPTPDKYKKISNLKSGDAVWVLAKKDFTFDNGNSTLEPISSSLLSVPETINSYDILNPIIIDVHTTELTVLSAISTNPSLIKVETDKDTGKVTITPQNRYGVATVIVTAFKDGVSTSKTIKVNLALSASTTIFSPVNDLLWDELAVNKVLSTFAFGGFATEEQIKIWADLSPEIAIKQMLTFDKHNPLLSPPDLDNDVPEEKNFKELQNIFGDTSSTLYPIKTYRKNRLKYSDWSGFPHTWSYTSNMRGFNPFREKIGFWETNYHLTLNKANAIHNHPYTQYYDDIMQGHEDNLNYEDIISIASLSAGIAYQYGHNRNRYYRGVFYGNEDFAREYHQVFFGILGDYNPDYHETVTIKNTAKALSDMTGEWHTATDGINDGKAYLDPILTFGTEFHYPATLEIYNTPIEGSTAQERIRTLSHVAIDHSESLNNLPVFIIESLADDNLDEEKREIIRNSWKTMQNKNLLKFIQNYATSNLFHSINRIKYRTSIDRNILFTNKYTLDNYESYHELNYQTSSKDGFEPFSLLHDVFGHQTGKEAFNSPEVFANAYTNATQKNWHFRYYHETLVDDDGRKIVDEETGATIYTPWVKEWGKVIPANSDNKYVVKDVAKWLWNHFVGDNERNFTTLEKAHIYALLNGKDLGYFLYTLDTTRDPEHDYTVEELESFESEINDASISVMKINSDDKDERIESSRYIKYAVAFISALPYTFVEEGR